MKSGVSFYLDRFIKKGTSLECSVFQAAALDTWNRIGFSRSRFFLKIHEATITQNLVYELILLKEQMGLSYRIFEATEEFRNGNDLEILVRTSTGNYFPFAVQAKIIYHNTIKGQRDLSNGTYFQLPHEVRGVPQINLLLDYAEDNKMVPLYLLYNYVQSSLPLGNLCGIEFNLSQYGCSILHAQTLLIDSFMQASKLRRNINFTELHPFFAYPWFILTCCFQFYKREEILQFYGMDIPTSKISDFTDNDIGRSQQWRELNYETLISQNVEKNEKLTIKKFSPRFRIMIG